MSVKFVDENIFVIALIGNIVVTYVSYIVAVSFLMEETGIPGENH
jgi:hypothetical protein